MAERRRGRDHSEELRYSKNGKKTGTWEEDREEMRLEREARLDCTGICR